MPPSLPHSDHSSSSSGSTSESFCLSSCSDYDSDFQASPSVRPNLETKPTLETQPELTSKADPTIYSFAWSESNSEHLSNLSKIANSSMSVVIAPNAAHPKAIRNNEPTADTSDCRKLPPTLPRPVYWSSLTHRDIFKDYIDAEVLGPQGDKPNTPSVATKETRKTTQGTQEPLSKNYSNMEFIKTANTQEDSVSLAPHTWVDSDFLSNEKLPVPFNLSLVSRAKDMWLQRDIGNIGDQTFSKLPDISSEKTAMDWCNGICHTLGIIHGLVKPPTESANITSGNDQSKNLPDRVFNADGHNKPLPGGLDKRKPDIILVDRTVAKNDSIRWQQVQALVEVSTQTDRFASLKTTLLSKASVIFESQLHRQYVLGLAFFGKGLQMKFFFTLIDRAGVVCTAPTLLRGYEAMTLLRILFAFKFGSNDLLGMDSRVTINHVTGDPTRVLIDNQTFKIVQEIHTSPYLFSRGTRVYVVEDEHGHFHIFKDSWILATHKGSEIEHIKTISKAADEAGSTDSRSRFLRPRFFAGEDNVTDTTQPRGSLTRKFTARIRRRIVTGPIGDPITSYRSRVEFLQAMIDVVDQLDFMYNKCGLVHGDISISNVVIVRFLPSILAASDAAAHQLSTTTGNSPTTTTVDPGVGHSLLFGSEDGKLVPWETVQPSTDTGLPHSLGSGGSVIDFDYTCPKDTVSEKTSGTMPYMSLELMLPQQPMKHELMHDLESVLMVILHILRFTCGPTASPTDVVKPAYCISFWHHEASLELIRDRKRFDINAICRKPTAFITKYWAPIAGHLEELIKTVYPTCGTEDMQASSSLTCESFNKILIAARDDCKNLQERTSNYATFMTKKRKNTDARDRGKQKQSRPLPKDTGGAPTRRRSRPAGSAQVSSLSQSSQYQASGSAV